jgi:photosystem II stability/assembly factor-like uncharacterized protein
LKGENMHKFRGLFFVVVILLMLGAAGIYGSTDNPQHESSKIETELKGRDHITYRDDLYDIDFADADYGWTIGCWGRIFHTKDGGKNWYPQNSKVDNYLYSVSFTDRLNGWIVGNYGTILHTKDGGEIWESQKSGTEKHLFEVEFLNKSEGWAVGYWGLILFTSDGGKTWQDKSIKEDIAFNSLSLLGEHCWVVGEFGAVYHTTDKGEHWEKQNSGVGEDVSFFGVDFSNSSEGWAVGLEGTVISTKDGGKTWLQVSDTNGFKDSIFDILVTDKGVFGVGGRGSIIEIIANPGDGSPFKKIVPDTVVFSSLAGACIAGESIWTVGYHGTILKFHN